MSFTVWLPSDPWFWVALAEAVLLLALVGGFLRWVASWRGIWG